MIEQPEACVMGLHLLALPVGRQRAQRGTLPVQLTALPAQLLHVLPVLLLQLL